MTEETFSHQLKRLEFDQPALQQAVSTATDEQWVSFLQDPYWTAYRLKALAERLDLKGLEKLAQCLLVLKPARLKDLVVLSNDVHTLDSGTGLALWQKVCLLARSQGMLLSFFQELRAEHGRMPAVAMQLWQMEEAIGILKPRQIEVIFNNPVAILAIRAQLIGAILAKRKHDVDCKSLVTKVFFAPHEQAVESATQAAMAALTLQQAQCPAWKDLVAIAIQDLSSKEIDQVFAKINQVKPAVFETP